MGVGVESLGSILFDASLSATVLLCLAALGLVGCRQPVRRVYLARTALVCSLALLPLAAFSPLPRVPVVRLLRNAVSAGQTLAEPVDEVPEVAPAAVEPTWPVRWANVTLRALPRPGVLLMPLYLAGVLAGLAWLMLGYWGLGRLRRGARVPAPETAVLYAALPWDSPRTRPRLRVTERVSRPVLVGTLRPMIVIPAALDRPEASEPLRLSLLHELAHAEAWDPLFSLCGRLAQVFWFFLPPAWWIRAQLALDHEFLADRRAALKFGHVPSYASSLLGMASYTGAGQAARPAPGTAGLTGSALVQRMLMLVQCPFPVESRPPAWWVRLLPVLLVPATLASSSLRLRESAAAPSPTTARPAHPARIQTFRVPRLTVPPKPAGPHGRAPLFELPIRLPATFDLTVHIWGTPSSLAQTRVVGLRLGRASERLQSFGAPPSWHLVHIRRESAGGLLSLHVDDCPVPLDAEKGVPTSWLSVEPAPDQEGQFEHLKLSW